MKLQEHQMNREDLINAIKQEGVENVRLIVPLSKLSMTTPFGFGFYDANNLVPTECKIDESRYKLEDNYKIGVVPVNHDGSVASDDFYMYDFISLIKDGHIKIK